MVMRTEHEALILAHAMLCRVELGKRSSTREWYECMRIIHQCLTDEEITKNADDAFMYDDSKIPLRNPK